MTLDTRIAAALRDGVNSEAVAAVLSDARNAIGALDADIASAHADAMSPLLDAEAVAGARRTLTDASFSRQRLTVAIGALTDRVEHLRETERQVVERAERDAAIAERDELADTIRDEVPGLIRRITEIVRDIHASDVRLTTAGVAEGAETIARGYPAHGHYAGGGAVMRLRDAKLPLFDGQGVAWFFDHIRGTAAWPGAEA